MKILIAEDEVVSRRLLQRTLEKMGHTVVATADGEAAWQQFEQNGFSVVITDWTMPRMDGLELIRRIRALDRRGYTYVLLLTARSEHEDIVVGLQAGADDFVTKPFDATELSARLRSCERIVTLEQRLAGRNRELEAANFALFSANSRMKRELETAACIQASLLPKVLPSVAAFEFAWQFKPCAELAGDILNIFRLDEKHIGLYVLDVSDHGVSAALLAVTLSHLLSPTFSQSTLLKKPVDTAPGYELVSPSEVARQLNRMFPMRGDYGQYFTLIYGLLNIETAQLTYVQAGHPCPILWTATTQEACFLEGEGLPIGFLEDPGYEDRKVGLRQGDRLFFYSDGLTEARNPRGQQFGESALLRSINSCAEVGIDQALVNVLNGAERWTEANSFRDDVSLAAVDHSGRLS
ncbi:MAG: SpoIIE family protein phosphatase [Acidobacteriota bacterium]